MLSTPVCGVESRNETVAARLAPWRRNEAATGITPHEHSGKGTPSIAAFNTGQTRGRPGAADELRRNAHRKHARHEEAEQQVRRDFAQHRPAFQWNIRRISIMGGLGNAYPCRVLRVFVATRVSFAYPRPRHDFV